MHFRSIRKGTALVLAMIIFAIISAWTVSIFSMTGTNVQLANNYHKVNLARSCAESGLDVVRFWLDQVSISGTTAEEMRFTEIANSFQTNLIANGITNITPTYDSTTVNISNVTLDSAAGRIPAVIRSLDTENIQVDITGTYKGLSRTIRADYQFGARANTVFDFGVASKGPLELSGNIELEGVNVSVESSVYIESEDSPTALSIIGNSQIAGDVSIVNPFATVDLQGGQAGIGGETGQDAIDNHVFTGVPPTEFPEPTPGYFEQYIDESVVDSGTDTSADATFENVRILAGTNPSFTGNVTLKGIVFIETPNVVTFSGSADVTGIIVGDGDIADNSGANQVNFLGNVSSISVNELPSEPQFDGVRDETGTFVVAPGFSVSFGGSFSAINGAIASNGVEFFGNAGGIINGSVINYSDETMTLSGNSDLYFNRSGTTQVPAGFVPEIILQYVPISYSEISI